MAVAYFREFPSGIDPAQVQQVSQHIMQQLGGAAPEGGIYHAEGPTDAGGWWTFEVFDTEASAERFYREITIPTLEQFNLPDASPRQLTVAFETSQMMPH